MTLFTGVKLRYKEESRGKQHKKTNKKTVSMYECFQLSFIFTIANESVQFKLGDGGNLGAASISLAACI